MRALVLAPLLLTAACVSPIDYGNGSPAQTDAPLDAAIDGYGIDTPPGEVHDEDADGVPDDIDLCPTVWREGSLVPDGDSDGVGDDCDPQPGVDNDLVFFAPFNKNDPDWKSEGDTTWSLVEGALETDQQSPASGAFSPASISGPVKVTARFTVVNRHGDVDVSLFDSYDPIAGEGTECYLVQPANTPGATLVYSLFYMGDRNASERQTVTFTQGTLAAGATVVLTAQHDRNPNSHAPIDKRCGASNSNGSVQVARTYGPADTNTRIRVTARNANVRVDYVIAYSLSF